MSLSVALSHSFDGFDLDVSFEAPKGVTVLFGRSGSGKTTVINAVAGLLRARQARVVLDSDSLCDTGAGLWVPPNRRKLGYVFQEGRLFPHLTVRQNLLYGRWFARHRESTDDWDRIIGILGLGSLLDRRPADLSGGEKQRVAIGRALLARPRLILADEPLASLDDLRKAEILTYLERLRDEFAIPALYVTHSAAEVARLATTVVVLQDGQVVRQGTAAEVLSDPNIHPTGIRDAGAVLQARVQRHHDDGLTELCAGAVHLFLPKISKQIGDSVQIRVAAHDVILARDKPTGLSALNVLPGVIRQVHPGDGPGAIVSLQTDAGTLLARITRRSAETMGLHPGLACYAVVKSVAIAPGDIGNPGGS